MNAQRRALIALSEVGELLVSEFPYEVPEDGKYANLPRLLGRCKVTFTFQRGNKVLGDAMLLLWSMDLLHRSLLGILLTCVFEIFIQGCRL